MLCLPCRHNRKKWCSFAKHNLFLVEARAAYYRVYWPSGFSCEKWLLMENVHIALDLEEFKGDLFDWPKYLLFVSAYPFFYNYKRNFLHLEANNNLVSFWLLKRQKG